MPKNRILSTITQGNFAVFLVVSLHSNLGGSAGASRRAWELKIYQKRVWTMLIGVPKEIKNLEFRVGLTPASVRELIANGHQAIVQKNAGFEIWLTR